MACRIADAVSAGMDVSSDTFWEGGRGVFALHASRLTTTPQSSSCAPFLTVLKEHKSVTLFSSQTLWLRNLGSFFLAPRTLARSTLLRRTPTFRPFMRLVLASIHFKKRVPVSNIYALKRLAKSLTRKEGMRCLWIREVALTAAEAEQQLLLPWNAVPIEMSIFEAILASSSSTAAAAAGSTAGSEGSYTALATASEHIPVSMSDM
eukprot:6213823-Pleurochrysis_carterae.AAC.6